MNETVFHTRYGRGEVTETEENRITVRFEDASVGSRKFPYPEAFEFFLCCEDENKQAEMTEALKQKRAAAAEARQEHFAEEHRRMKEAALERDAQLKAQRKQAAALRRKAKATK